MIKGLIQTQTLESGFTADYWRTGQVTFLFNEEVPNTPGETKFIKADMVLYKDQQSEAESKKSTGVKVSISVPYIIEDEPLIVQLLNRLYEKALENDFFKNATPVEI